MLNPNLIILVPTQHDALTVILYVTISRLLLSHLLWTNNRATTVAPLYSALSTKADSSTLDTPLFESVPYSNYSIEPLFSKINIMTRMPAHCY